MKLKILILLFSIASFAQNADVLKEIKIIDSQVKYIDSISNFQKEENRTGIIVVAHGKTQVAPINTSTSIIKLESRIARICYRENDNKTVEDLHLYFVNSKLIYVEVVNWRSKRRFHKQKLYYQNNILIAPEYSKKFDLEKEMEIFEKARRVIKEASS